jgi:magnesium-transporting ATPase (P-type)
MAQNNNENKANWHALKSEEVIEKLQTNKENGLSDSEISERQEKYGRNELPKARKQSWVKRLLLQFNNILIYVLIAAAIITALMDHWVDTWVILSVVIINALIGFIQEGKAEKALEGIREMLSLDARVIRDKNKNTIDAEELVPGDIVLLKSGDKIPADIRIVKSKDLRVEESPLTGESTAVEKSVEPVEKDAIIGDRLSMAFSGTVVTYGKATGVVVAIGSDTEIGKINQMISEVKKITTPLLQQIEKFGKWLSLVILVITGVFFTFGRLYHGTDLTEMFLAAIGLVVAAIPEGLPAIMTITLATGVQRMAKRNAIIRRLPSVETLGAVDVICSDKTGTLTRNEMTAKTIITTEKEFSVEGTGYEPEGEISHNDKSIKPEDDKVLWQLLQTIRISNNAEINKDENGKWKLSGVPTEGALLVLSYKAGLKDLKTKRIDHIPFESEHKFMATLNKTGQDTFIYSTGAPERMLEICEKQYTSEGEQDLDKDFGRKKLNMLLKWDNGYAGCSV